MHRPQGKADHRCAEEETEHQHPFQEFDPGLLAVGIQRDLLPCMSVSGAIARAYARSESATFPRDPDNQKTRAAIGCAGVLCSDA